jgi:hypothetical protein
MEILGHKPMEKKNTFFLLGWAESLFLLLILSLILSASFGCLFLLSFNISSSQSIGYPTCLWDGRKLQAPCGQSHSFDHHSFTNKLNYVLLVLAAPTFFPFRSYCLGNSSLFLIAGIIWPETRNHRPKSSDESQWFLGTLQFGAIPAPFSDLPSGNLT